MKMKNLLLYKVYSGIVLLVLPCLIFSGCVEKHDDPVLIQIGDYRVTRAIFKKAIDRLDAEGTGMAGEERAKAVLDDFINAGLLVNLARQHGYSSDRDYQRELQYYTSVLYSKYGKLARCGLQGLPVDIDKDLERSGVRPTATIDYIYIPASQKDVYKEMRERMDAGANTADLVKTSRFGEWDRLHLRFYTDVSTNMALLPEKVLEKINRMKAGELAYFEDGPGKYIVKVKKQLLENVAGGSAGNRFLQLKMAECVEKGDTLMDPYDLGKKIQGNQDLFDLGNFFVLPVTDAMEPGNTDPVVIEFEGKKIHETQLRSEISGLPISVQVLFRNEASRVWLITNYILHRYADLAETRQRAEQADQHLIRQFLGRRLQEDKVTDTVGWLMGIFRKTLPGGSPSSAYEILADSAGIGRLKGKLAVTQDEEQRRAGKGQDYSWLFSDRQPGCESLRLNFSAIHKMSFGDGMSIGDNEILAAGGQWKLRVGDFKMQLGQMSSKSRVLLTWNGNAVKAIHYLAHEQGGLDDKAAIKINYNLIDRVDMVGKSFDSLNDYASDEAVAILQGTRLTEGRIRQIVASMPENERFEFLSETDSRNDAIKRMLLDQYWQDQADPRQLKGNPQFREELVKYENWLLAKAYYQKCFYVEPSEVGDESLDRDIRKACKVLSEERLIDGLLKEARQNCIKVNIDLLRQLGVDITASTYSGLINKNCH